MDTLHIDFKNSVAQQQFGDGFIVSDTGMRKIKKVIEDLITNLDRESINSAYNLLDELYVEST